MLDQGAEKVISSIKTEILGPVVKVLFALAFIYFLWGVFQYIRGADNEDARAIGKRHMFWGIIGLAIMVGAQGLVTLINTTVSGF